MTIISNSHKFIFVHLHKCGGTSIEVTYEQHSSWNDIILGSTEMGEMIDSKYNILYGIHKHSSAKQISHAIKSADDYDFITVVRHPLERLISLFKWIKRAIVDWCIKNHIHINDLNSLISERKANPEFMQWEPFYLFLNSNEMFSFSQFIRDIYNHVPEWYPSCDNALVPMIESISGPRMHKVFKLEEISEFWPWMSDRVMKNCVPIVLNSSDVNIDEEIGLKLNLELDNDARLKFLKMYASDLRFFNYEI